MFRQRVSAVARVQVRQFSTTSPRLAVSPYQIFLKETYKNKALTNKLKGMPITKRGPLIAKWYHALSFNEKARLAAVAAKAPTNKRKMAPKAPKKKPSEYNLFVRKASKLPEIQALEFKDRMAAIAKKWAKSRKL